MITEDDIRHGLLGQGPEQKINAFDAQIAALEALKPQSDPDAQRRIDEELRRIGVQKAKLFEV